MAARPSGPRGPEPAYTGYQSNLDPRNAFTGQQYAAQQRFSESESDIDDQYRRDSYGENGSNPALDQPYYDQNGGYDPYGERNIAIYSFGACWLARGRV